ncbi:MAG: DUF4380 domain-containing protein [Phycisphaeraceae bacterium]
MKLPQSKLWALVRCCEWAVVMAMSVAVASGCRTTAAHPPANSDAAGVRAGDERITLSNHHVRLGVSVNTGRLLEFGPREGTNLLWLNDEALDQPLPEPGTPLQARRSAYRNYGGDKVWPTVQGLWARAYGSGSTWPPDGVIDGQPWRLLVHEPQRIVMRSDVHPTLNVYCEREIHLDPDRPTARITNRLTRVAPSLFPVHIWTITQVRQPQAVLLDVAPDRVADLPWVALDTPRESVEQNVRWLDETVAAWRFPREPAGKIGTLGRWIAGVWEEWVFLQTVDDYDPAAAYPDASNVQAFADDRYTELELLSPFVHLQPGESVEHTVTWHLLPRRGRSVEQVIEALQAVRED